MTSTSLFNAVIQEIIGCNEFNEYENEIEGIMFRMDACLFLAYSYISKNSIYNKMELYEIFFQYAKKNGVLINQYNEYLLDNEEISIDEYIFNIFLQDDSIDISYSYVGQNGYDIPCASFFILRKIMIILLD
jgi:hypothetical protein